MALWDRVTEFLALRPVMEERSIDSFVDHPDLTTQLLAVQGLHARPWRAASVREAMGIPAIFRAVSLIANTVGSLSMEAYRQGEKLNDEDTPRILKRPDPFKTPRTFFRDTAYNLAAYGESWWWVAKRDIDGAALSLIVVPPWEVETIENDRDRLRPTIKWLQREMPRDDMRQITYLPDGRGLRGVGPLQLCGAALSVSVESQEWAANFYAAGGYPNMIIKSAVQLSPDPDSDGYNEADRLKEQWIRTSNNTPKVIDPGIEEVTEFGADVEAGNMLEARNYQNGEAARMFGIPGSLLEYSQPGSSLTYQNVEGEYTKFHRTCLEPNYLEPIQQEISDLLPRATVARFYVGGILKADIKTRWEVYKNAVEVLGQEEASLIARREEGLIAGNSDFAPVPLAPPQAVPRLVPPEMRSLETRSAIEVRCQGSRVINGRFQECGRLLGKVAPPYELKCPKCYTVSSAEAPPPPEPLVVPIPIQARSKPELTVVPPDPELAALREQVAALSERPPQVINLTVPPNVIEHAEPVQIHPRTRRIERDGTGLISAIIEE